ncbi:MAG: putative toxin-antitoxin system toxin component, PIN family [Candidatus Omnitrophota bacterium]|nr:putative toxin-antitoxin system toxin component, PIN family [Candidatus Omnitrophota bacterium]
MLDTNVLISSLWHGRCWEVVKRWRDDRMTLVISSAVLREYLDVLSRFVTPALLQEWVDALTDPTRVTMVEPAEQIDVVRADPSDNRFLECALAAHADAVISGDHHLLTLKTFRDIPILTPSAFLEQGS